VEEAVEKEKGNLVPGFKEWKLCSPEEGGDTGGKKLLQGDLPRSGKRGQEYTSSVTAGGTGGCSGGRKVPEERGEECGFC